MNGWLWVPTAWIICAMLAGPLGIGKQRKPLEASPIVVIMVIQMGLIFCILKGGGVL